MKKAIIAGISAIILIVILAIGITMNRTASKMLEVGDFALILRFAASITSWLGFLISGINAM